MSSKGKSMKHIFNLLEQEILLDGRVNVQVE